MSYKWATWMADEFRAAGLDVVEVDGWKTRGRPASSGSFDPFALNVHHTGGTSSALSPTPALSLLVGGRSDLPGPIAHFATDYHGRIWVIAAGRANVNGSNRGVPNIPAGDGNRDLMGNEVFTNGTQAMPQAQLDAIALSSVVVLEHFGRPVDGYLYRHQDTSKTGKWDIGQLSTARLRAITKAVVRGTPTPPEDDMTPEQAKQLDEVHNMLRGGADGLNNNFEWLAGRLAPELLHDAKLRGSDGKDYAVATWLVAGNEKAGRAEGAARQAVAELAGLRAVVGALASSGTLTAEQITQAARAGADQALSERIADADVNLTVEGA